MKNAAAASSGGGMAKHAEPLKAKKETTSEVANAWNTIFGKKAKKV